MLDDWGYRGSCAFTGDTGTSLFYGGGHLQMIYETTTGDYHNWSPVSKLPVIEGVSNMYTDCIADSHNTVILIGALNNTLQFIEFDLTTKISKAITTSGDEFHCDWVKATSDPVAQNTTIFCSDDVRKGIILSLHHPSKTVTKLFEYNGNFGESSVAFDGVYAYVTRYSIGAVLPWIDEILMFNTRDHTHGRIPVEGIPRCDGGFSETTSVYVPKLNRIYFFGGSCGIDLDGIWYIDLDRDWMPNFFIIAIVFGVFAVLVLLVLCVRRLWRSALEKIILKDVQRLEQQTLEEDQEGIQLQSRLGRRIDSADLGNRPIWHNQVKLVIIYSRETAPRSRKFWMCIAWEVQVPYQ